MAERMDLVAQYILASKPFVCVESSGRLEIQFYQKSDSCIQYPSSS